MTSTTEKNKALLRRVEAALRRVSVPLPHFAGLIHAVRLELDDRVPTAGIFASGRMVLNPEFLGTLREDELLFVLAHELFHLALRTHDRARGSDPSAFNVAHDYIINDMLRVELGFERVPAGGLDRPGARLLSAEEILQELRDDPSTMSLRPRPGNGQGTGDGQRGTLSGLAGDVLTDAQERDWFPEESESDRQARTGALREQVGKALGLNAMMDALKAAQRGKLAGSNHQQVAALRGLYRTPWETALQRWLESVATGPRTFYRPSRRGAERIDLVLPGRKREGWILNIVLDTSGSMTDTIPRALGAIADFCEAVSVDQIRLVQCDTAVTSDQLLSPGELARYAISGYGGSDLSPALRHLAEDPRVEAVVVLTDGEIDYPPEEMPFAVLWVLPASAPGFQPNYGFVLVMQPS